MGFVDLLWVRNFDYMAFIVGLGSGGLGFELGALK